MPTYTFGITLLPLAEMHALIQPKLVYAFEPQPPPDAGVVSASTTWIITDRGAGGVMVCAWATDCEGDSGGNRQQRQQNAP